MIREIILEAKEIDGSKFIGKKVWFADETGIHTGILKSFDTKNNMVKIDTGRGKNRGGDGVEEYSADVHLFDNANDARKFRG